MVHFLDCRATDRRTNELSAPIFPNGVAAYGISFPGERDGRRIKRLATYQVNTTWMKERYGDEIENDDDLGDDI